MSSRTRRSFVLHVLAAGSLVAITRSPAYAVAPKLEESDAQAVALGYKQDTTKVDSKKYPNHVNSQSCANCQLFQGKAGDAAGGCPLFAGKEVSAAGWCSAWAKKAT